MASLWKPFRKDIAAVISLCIIAAVVVLALGAPLFAPYDPTEQFADGLSDIGAPLPPDGKFWLGTDLLGRDLFSRLLFGGRNSLLIGLLANGAALFIGTVVGVVAGYIQGRVGNAIMRFTDLMMAIPALLLAIALAIILQRSVWIVALVIALVNWVQVARVIYTETVGLAARDFVRAAGALGAGPLRVLWRHILPHLLPTLLVYGTLGISTTVMLEAMLSFLGVGVQPPDPSWGGIIFESQSYLMNAPWLVIFPGVVILAVALSCNLVGDALRDALDPLQRRQVG
ncbi:MAG TPA: ABC transporter permease [Verrucomicrobiae bacterium]|jgi:peptide/nickel transport system permease protein|nr:ABC transporter permease [Verrucomicrobiae bacterium]